VSVPGLPLGQGLKRFQLERIIGAGGMGQVYRAHDARLHRPVAVKLLAAELFSDAQRKQRFIQEARAAARINHPAIAQVYDVDEQEGVAFIAMELIEGKTVRELIQNRELDMLGALEIAVHVAEGLSKAHELGIVHRDIKPANVMLTGDGHVKILDFGLAKLLDRGTAPAPGNRADPGWTPLTQTESGMVMGTAAYMSPEQVRGAEVDHRADIFSVGVLLYEMTTGQSPFQRGSFVDTLHAVAFDETQAMTVGGAALPGELQRIVSRCLQKRPEDRYADAGTLAHDLRALRRDTEAGQLSRTAWLQRLTDAWENLRQVPPSRYGWAALGLAGVALALRFSFAKIGLGGALFVLLVGLFAYRYVRNRPQRLQWLFVRRVSRIPEVRLIQIQDRQAVVVVDRSAAQLYSRIHTHLRSCNGKLFHGRPLTVSIQAELSPEQQQRLLANPGVEYIRPDVVGQ
jgi:predicted Ser/Thr protein kinase